MNYPKHKHPHGIKDTIPSKIRIWVCEECNCIFTDNELRADGNWGHVCKSHTHRNATRCEAHLEPYTPEVPL